MEKRPSLLLSIFPVIILVLVLVAGVNMFGDDLTSGPSQIALITAGVIGAAIGIFYLKVTWEKIEEKMSDNLSKTGSALFILLMIGALTASWIQSGVVPALIYYGLELINPTVFLLVVFLFTAIISTMAGSSWTTIGTIGVAMLSAGQILGFNSGLLAGAIISGAYFGDKVSPLSDTTNLSASISQVDLYKHVKYMLVTNIPLLVITAIIFTVIGFLMPSADNLDIEKDLAEIAAAYNITPWLLLIPCATIYMIYKKISPFLTLFLSAVLGCIVALFAQPQIIAQITPYAEGSVKTWLYAPIKIMSSHVDISTGNEMLNGLVSTNGMAGMLNTIWLILCVVVFGGIMEACGYIQTVTDIIVKRIKSVVSLVASTMASCIFCNIVLSDQYMSILIPGKMFKKIYEDEGYNPELLSRSLQDSAAVTSVLIPWNTCGVAQSGVLDVPTLEYLPYCFYNWLSPFVNLVVVFLGYKIYRFGKPVGKLIGKRKEKWGK